MTVFIHAAHGREADTAAALLAAAETPHDVRTVSGVGGVVFEVPEYLAAAAPGPDAPADTPAAAPRKRTPRARKKA